MYAAANGHEQVVRLLLRYRAKVNETSFWGETALSMAIDRRQPSIVALLLGAGAKVNIRTVLGTPLSIACSNGDLKVARMLLEANAEVNVSNPGSCSPLSWAKKSGNRRLVALLRRYGAH